MMLDYYGEDYRIDVSSSMISAVGVRDDYLIVWFTNGSAYRYKDASFMIDVICGAESVGKCFNEEVKDCFTTQKLGHSWPEDC